jgi:hypothetical protein
MTRQHEDAGCHFAFNISAAAFSAQLRTNSEIPCFRAAAARAIRSFCASLTFISIRCRFAGLDSFGTASFMAPELCRGPSWTWPEPTDCALATLAWPGGSGFGKTGSPGSRPQARYFCSEHLFATRHCVQGVENCVQFHREREVPASLRRLPSSKRRRFRERTLSPAVRKRNSTLPTFLPEPEG